jgi:hypothetical protein
MYTQRLYAYKAYMTLVLENYDQKNVSIIYCIRCGVTETVIQLTARAS